jgi:hypothetical protein
MANAGDESSLDTTCHLETSNQQGSNCRQLHCTQPVAENPRCIAFETVKELAKKALISDWRMSLNACLKVETLSSN